MPIPGRDGRNTDHLIQYKKKPSSSLEILRYVQSGLIKDHGQLARASENFAGPVDFETPRPDWPVQFLTSPPITFLIMIVTI